MAPLLGQPQASTPSLGDLVTTTAPSSPPTPRDGGQLAKFRAYHEETTWAPEIDAQDHGRLIVDLWDEILKSGNKLKTLGSLQVEKFSLGSEAKTVDLTPTVTQTNYGAPLRELDRDDLANLIENMQADGVELEGIEFEHDEFVPATDAEGAKSTVRFKLMLSQGEPKEQRYVVTGNASLTWSAEATGSPARFSVVSMEVPKFEILTSNMPVPFKPAMQLPFNVGSTARSTFRAINPLILRDLNGDNLPEVILAGQNVVFWNGGRWRFRQGRLCDHFLRSTTAAIFADVTEDGIDDLIMGAPNAKLLLYKGTGEGKFPDVPRELTFSDKPLRGPSSIAVGDIDGDSDLDLYVGQSRSAYLSGNIPTPYFDGRDSYPGFLLLNDGHGDFTDATKAAGLKHLVRRRVRSVSFVDADRDGDLDLLMTSDFRGTELSVNDGTGKFTAADDRLLPQCLGHGRSHSIGDFNQDGKLDFCMLATSSPAARRLESLGLERSDLSEHQQLRQRMSYGNRLLLGGEGGQFLQPVFNDQLARTGWPNGSTSFDFDRDGALDVYVANGWVTGESPRDYDSKYWCHDIHFDARERPVRAIQQYFQKFRGLFGRQFSWAGNQHNALLMNLDGNGFRDVAFLTGANDLGDCRAVVSGDLDLDGRVDLIYESVDAVGEQAHVRFMKNVSSDDNNWLGVHLDPTTVDQKTEGATVSLILDDGTKQIRTTNAGDWGTQGTRTVHFGLGKAESVAEVNIHWPNGSTTTLNSPATNAYHSSSAP